MTARRIVFIGLSLSSSWGNGHATTYRALLRGLAAQGCELLFLERDAPWYAAHRDMLAPEFCELLLYDAADALARDHASAIAGADAVIIGSYVPDGIAVIDFVMRTAGGLRAFYDIDTPVTLATLERGDAAYLAWRQVPLFDLYLSFTGGPMLRRLEQGYGAARACTLYCAVDPALYRPAGGAAVWDLGYLGTYSADRQAKLEALLIEPARRMPQRRFVVAGPQYPARLDWPANVDRIAHVPPDEHAAFYARQRFTLNITRADMVAAGWSPSVRLFEAACCGVPIISDRWNGLHDLLPSETAVLTADTADDIQRLLSSVDNESARSLATNARAIVLSAHTGAARARQLLMYLEEAERDRAQVRRTVAERDRIGLIVTQDDSG